jgi:hypothetical protein
VKQDATSRVSKLSGRRHASRDKIDEAVVFELKWTENMKDTESKSDRREESSHDGAVRGGRVAS